MHFYVFWRTGERQAAANHYRVVGGSYIHKFRQNGKNAVVFYHYPIERRSRRLSPIAIGFRKLSDALTDPNFQKCVKVAREANQAIRYHITWEIPDYDKAEEVYSKIAGRLIFGEEWLGLAVVRRWDVENFISSYGYQKTVWDEGPNYDVLIIVR